jgi:hypothetical protein
MNRLKLWVYVVLVLGAGGALVAWASRDAASRALRQMDASLRAAEAHAGSIERLAAAEAAAVAQRAARDPALAQAILAAEPPPPPARRRRAPAPSPQEEASRQADVERAGQAGVDAAARALGVALPAGSFSTAASRPALARPAADARRREVTAWLRAAAAGEVRKGAVRLGEGLWYGAAAPAGDGGAVAVFLPLDDAWAKRLAAATGADVSLSAGLPKPVGAAGPTAAAASKAAAAAPGVIASVGALGRIEPSLALPVKVPALPLLLASAPEARAVAVPVAGVDKALVVLSVAAAPRLEPVVRFQWIAVATLGVALLLAIVLGLLLGEERARVPDDLVEAAERLAARDFTARAPSLAGRLGTVAQGLNAAAEAASRATSDAPAAAPAPFAAEPYAAAPVAEQPSAFGERPAPEPTAAPEPLPAPPQALFTTSKLDAGALEAPSRAAPPPSTSAASLLGAAARAAPAAAGDEGHWEEVFQEFLRVRTECGESAEGLTFDRFRGKLEKNKDQLVQKYGCRTVRFQVYVKEGKAALKATPVR